MQEVSICLKEHVHLCLCCLPICVLILPIFSIITCNGGESWVYMPLSVRSHVLFVKQMQFAYFHFQQGSSFFPSWGYTGLTLHYSNSGMSLVCKIYADPWVYLMSGYLLILFLHIYYMVMCLCAHVCLWACVRVYYKYLTVHIQYAIQ